MRGGQSDRFAPHVGRSPSDEHLPNRGAREAEEKDLLPWLQIRDALLGLEQSDCRLARARPARHQKVTGCRQDILSLLVKLELQRRSPKSLSPGSGSGGFIAADELPRVDSPA